jgi:uncharacterized protein (TIGR00369 family)
MAGHDERSIEDEIRERVATSPFHASMGLVVDTVEPGRVEMRLEALAAHANLHGTVHGGVIATLADTAAGLAVRSMMPEPTGRHASVHLDVQFLSAAAPGPLHAVGTVVKLGRRLAFADADIRDAAGAMLARAHVTISLSAPAGDRRAGGDQ